MHDIHLLNPRLIFDIGMSEGNDTAYYLAKGFYVLGVEADPVMYAALEERFAAEIAQHRLAICNRAAGATTGDRIKFLHNEVQQGISGITKHPHVPTGYHEYLVETIGWSDLVKVAGIPYFCKIDIEGQETAFLTGVLRSQLLPNFTSVECHTIDPVALLYAAGYRQFKLIDQNPIGGFINVHPPREGLYVDQPDWWHASGPFGEELPGDRWLSFEEFIIAHKECEPQRIRTWFDCHARR